MNERRLLELIDVDFPPMHVTKGAVEEAVRHSYKQSSGSVRLDMGRVYTDEEMEERRRNALVVPLP